MSNHNDKNKLNSGKPLTDNAEGNPEPSNIFYSLDHNKKKDAQTATPSKYPQGYFKDKPCKHCSNVFSPKAPSEMYCSDGCKEIGITDAYLKRNYGLSYFQYISMHKEQQGLCKICNREGYTMTEHHKLKLVVDHCHTTGKVRGLLCHDCNRALGLFKDDIVALQKAKEYIEGATTIPYGSTSQANGDGSGLPLTGNAEGDDIV
jgi:predicted nucleic acid-binding Zn ribbon protein